MDRSKIIRIVFIVLAISFGFILGRYSENSSSKCYIDSLRLVRQIDSLKSENTYKSIEIGRYEIIVGRLYDADEELANEVTKNLE
jgi:hypothetical protein